MKIRVKNIIAIGIIAMTLISCSGELKKADYQVIPLPKNITENATERPFILSKNVIVTYPTSQPELIKEANFLTEFLNEILGYELKIEASDSFKKGAINLSVDPTIFTEKDSYKIIVNENNINIISSEASSLFYAIQTLRKSLPFDAKGENIAMPATEIYDYPRFGHRGMMLDVSRHIFPLDSIKEYIDLMALHNMNKFHLHLTDDQGWRIEIKKYPKLTEVGAWRSGTKIGKSETFDTIRYGGFYTQEELRDLVKYAADRHITIIPEIDLPGHQLAALATYPELGCTGGPYEVWKQWGVADDVICAGNEDAMRFLEDVLTEVMDIFPSEYIHIGGDECPKVRWEKCPKCQAKIKELGFKDDEHFKAENYLQSYVMTRMEKFVEDHGRKVIGWDEILEGGLGPNVTVMSWRSIDGGKEGAKQHHDVIMTPCSHLYFDYYQTDNTDDEPLAIGGYIPVERVYEFEPIPSDLTEEEAKHILGAQANLWVEYIKDMNTVFYRILPRMDALTEVQWVSPEQKDYDSFRKRAYKMVEFYDLKGWNYAKHIFDINVEIVPNVEAKCIDVTMSKFGEGDILYTLDGSDPLTNGTKYTEALKLTENAKLRAIVKRAKSVGKEFKTDIELSKSSMKPITLKNEPHENYRFDGANTLIDGLSGGKNYKTGRWIAFFGENLDAKIDMIEEQEISNLSFQCNLTKGDWIFNAKSVTILGSNDGENYEEIHHQDFPIETIAEDGVLSYSVDFEKTNVRYINIIIEPHMCPEGHSGYGYPAWIFIDELKIN
ncbi:MAG: family 20 glycosylhydrolase [Bacteroidales bacterium]|nr:family 20 glycosylhydrolase [Bacteroidales bacterium]